MLNLFPLDMGCMCKEVKLSSSVGPARGHSRGYELNVGGYNKSSTGGDAMEYHSGMDFSTYDQDNDGATGE